MAIDKIKTEFLNKELNSFKNSVFILLSLLVTIFILLAYSNHFNNGFEIDDFHSIKDNVAIRQVTIGNFFADGTTISTKPANQSYRPYLTTENAIDYQLGKGGDDTQAFHIHIFITFLLVCILLCVFVKKILDVIRFSNYNQFWGLIVASIFGLLCANAETVNYIFQRAEIDSGLFILAGFVAYLSGGRWRNNYLYLIFPLIGFFAKEMTFVFAPLLLLYILIFEENVDLLHFYKAPNFNKFLNALKKCLPAILLTVVFFVFYKKMIPPTWTSGGDNTSHFLYLITQPMVMCHYLLTFFVPYNLSADTDWTVFPSIMDYRAIIGIILITAIIYVALRSSKNKDTHLFSFGLLWFFISLLPTSSVMTYSEVLNDHRCFIPYLGLTIAVVFGIRFILIRYFSSAIKQRSTQIAVFVFLILFLGANAYGVRQRNKVWKDELSLWKDVSEKSPNNGRGLMSYGVTLMAKGDYANAEIYYNKAMKFIPTYSYLYINMGILKEAVGDKKAAEENFKKAIACSMNIYKSYYFYARFLAKSERYEEAEQNVTEALKLSPNYLAAQYLLLEIYYNRTEWENLKNLAQGILNTVPNDAEAQKYLNLAIYKKSVNDLLEDEISKSPTPEKYLNLSLQYYRQNNFEKCIEAASNALKLKPNYTEAYNNIGIAWYNLKNYDKAIEAYHQALAIKPDNQLAKNNLASAEKAKQQDADLEEQIKKAPSAEKYLTLSVNYFQSNNFEKCIEAAKMAIKLKPENSEAYNNIGIAYTNLKQYDKAIQAYSKALAINPNNQFAKNNLANAIANTKK